jgi:CPA2 family monovalent cation:H+ antiporter-2
MPHDISLIATLAAGFGLAMVLGYGAARLRLPPLVGYLLAGVAIGPFTPGFVGDLSLAGQLAEVGVMLLMFGVGLHFSMADLMAVKRIAVPGAVVQIGVATLLGFALAQAWGWSVGGALVFGLALSVASTVVLLRALEDRGQLATPNGSIAVGWLVVEDLVMVLVLVLLPPLAGLLDPASHAASAGASSGLLLAVGLTLAKVGAFIASMLLVGRWLFPRVLYAVARTGSRELFTLCVIAVAISVAVGAAKLFDVSFALGAFFAGMMMRESQYSHRAADESLPLRDAFAVLFFVSVGMLFDPHVLVQEPLRVAAVVAVILVGKTLAAVGLVLLLRYPLSTALTVGVSLAQIGEFSFILASLGVGLKLLPAEGQSLILAGALISIALSTTWSFRCCAVVSMGSTARGSSRSSMRRAQAERASSQRCSGSSSAKSAVLRAMEIKAPARIRLCPSAGSSLSPTPRLARMKLNSPICARLTPTVSAVLSG